MSIDLHSHTTFSDGVLSPNALVQRASNNGVGVLAITDHDTVDAISDSLLSGNTIRLIAGIEFSTQWENTGVHVLGLNINHRSDAVSEGVRQQTAARLVRARKIAEKLEKKGVPDSFEGASAISAGHYIGRPHFARFLVDSGRVKNMREAFKKYLGDGKAGDIKKTWADLPQVIQWIRDANGIAVLAHPLKYKMTRTRLKRLLECFTRDGGQGMEVVSGKQIPQHTAAMAELCETYGLLASCGSDFHAPDTVWSEVGGFAPLPGHLTPVWERF